jgi:hypothetical protein
LLRPLPFPGAGDLYAVYTPATDGRFTTGRCSGVELARLNAPNVSIIHAAGSSRFDTTILRDDGTAVASVGYGVTEGFFDIFNLPMAAGRPFTNAEHAQGAPPVVILSHRIWRDPWILLSATAIVVALTFVAILVPARRAALTEPSAILRQE